jgi:hypothetical protein
MYPLYQYSKYYKKENSMTEQINNPIQPLENCGLECPYASLDGAGHIMCAVHYPMAQPAWCYLNKGKGIRPGLMLECVPEKDQKPLVTSDGRPVEIVIADEVIASSKTEAMLGNPPSKNEIPPTPILNVKSEVQTALNAQYPDITKPVTLSSTVEESILAAKAEERGNIPVKPVAPIELPLAEGAVVAKSATPSEIAAPAPKPIELTVDNVISSHLSDVKELKIVIVVKGQASTCGIQQTGCDPIFFTSSDGGISGVISHLDDNINICINRWITSPRAPRAILPEKPIPPQPAASTSPAKPPTYTPPKPAVASPPKPKIQPSMF